MKHITRKSSSRLHAAYRQLLEICREATLCPSWTVCDVEVLQCRAIIEGQTAVMGYVIVQLHGKCQSQLIVGTPLDAAAEIMRLAIAWKGGDNVTAA